MSATKPLYKEYNPVPGGRKSFMKPRTELHPQQLRELRIGHLNPEHPTAEEYNISPVKGRGFCQPVTRQEAIDFVNKGELPARLQEWERKALAGVEKQPRIEIPASTDGLHDA